MTLVEAALGTFGMWFAGWLVGKWLRVLEGLFTDSL